MPIPPEEISRFAALASLRLNQQELSRFSNELSHILDYIDQLKVLGTEAVAPQVTIFEGGEIGRKNDVKWRLSGENTLQHTDDRESSFYKAPKVIKWN